MVRCINPFVFVWFDFFFLLLLLIPDFDLLLLFYFIWICFCSSFSKIRGLTSERAWFFFLFLFSSSSFNLNLHISSFFLLALSLSLSLSVLFKSQWIYNSCVSFETVSFRFDHFVVESIESDCWAENKCKFPMTSNLFVENYLLLPSEGNVWNIRGESSRANEKPDTDCEWEKERKQEREREMFWRLTSSMTLIYHNMLSRARVRMRTWILFQWSVI